MRVETGCRLHFGLIDLNGEVGRIDGGIGLAIKKPGVILEVEEADELKVVGPHSKVAEKYVKRFQDSFSINPVHLEISSSIPRHVGLGSGTQIALAVAVALSRYNGIEINTRTLADIVGRGGTSGIGTWAFENGGLILDGGHSTDEKGTFLPSSASDASPPPLLSRIEFPDWNIKVFLPDGSGAHGPEEKSLFVSDTPIPINEVREVSHIVLMELLPSVQERNFSQFRQAIKSLQSTGWKRREVARQPKSEEIIEELVNNGVAAGLSSWGPAVFAISPDDLSRFEFECKSFETGNDNSGAIISNCP